MMMMCDLQLVWLIRHWTNSAGFEFGALREVPASPIRTGAPQLKLSPGLQ